MSYQRPLTLFWAPQLKKGFRRGILRQSALVRLHQIVQVKDQWMTAPAIVQVKDQWMTAPAIVQVKDQWMTAPAMWWHMTIILSNTSTHGDEG